MNIIRMKKGMEKRKTHEASFHSPLNRHPRKYQTENCKRQIYTPASVSSVAEHRARRP